jgi:predicted aminopeptidase
MHRGLPLLLLSLLGCKAGYIVRSGLFEASLLASRQPIDAVREAGQLSAAEEQALTVVAAAKRYGARIGLSATDNYGTLAVGWDRTIWNLSACDPLAFEAHTWWFPIVGRVPYLGYFRQADAERKKAQLASDGADVYLRTAGAFSTLGWFRDPLTPEMLTWEELDLAETVLHELAHATVWIRGSVSFNESLASFVGEEAALAYLIDRYGLGSPAHQAALAAREDARRWVALQQGLYEELDALYALGLPPDEALARKGALFASVPDRIVAAGLSEPERYLRSVARNPWNNARLIQFRTYNDDRPSFEALLQAEGGDLVRFLSAVKRITRGAPDPFAALRAAVSGAPVHPNH